MPLIMLCTVYTEYMCIEYTQSMWDLLTSHLPSRYVGEVQRQQQALQCNSRKLKGNSKTLKGNSRTLKGRLG